MPRLNRHLFFSVHDCNKMTHSSCKKWHTLFFDTLLMLKMIHSVVWHSLDTRNYTLCFYDTLLMLKMTHSVLWHTLDTRNDTVCFFSVSTIKESYKAKTLTYNYVLLIQSLLILQIIIVITFYSIIFITHFVNIEQYPLLQYIIKKYTSIYYSEQLIIWY